MKLTVASDGVEAVEKSQQLRPDLILMDLSMPRMSGIAAAREIHLLSPTSKILFLSENWDVDVIRASFEVGGSGYLLKSDAFTDLIPGIRAVLLDQQFVSNSLRDWSKTSNSTEVRVSGKA